MIRLKSDVQLHSIRGQISGARGKFCFHVQKEPYGKCMVKFPSLTYNVYVEINANVKYKCMKPFDTDESSLKLKSMLVHLAKFIKILEGSIQAALVCQICLLVISCLCLFSLPLRVVTFCKPFH